MCISDCSSDVCPSDLVADAVKTPLAVGRAEFVDEGLSVLRAGRMGESADVECRDSGRHARTLVWIGCSGHRSLRPANANPARRDRQISPARRRSEEHTSELQSLMRISYAVFCLKTKNHVQVLKLIDL